MKKTFSKFLVKFHHWCNLVDTRVFLVGVAIAMMAGLWAFNNNGLSDMSMSDDSVVPTLSDVGFVMSSSTPLRLRIPKIDLDVPFSPPLGLNGDGEVETPEEYDVVGWYKYGPTPGALGPAVVLGHVDSYNGPAVFFSLGQLEEGSDVYVDREDGSVAHFIVTKLERHSQNDFPTKDVYGDVPYAGLRLVTCTGLFDRGNQRYTHNLIVYAKLIEGQ